MTDTYDIKTIDSVIEMFIALLDIVFPRSHDGSDSIKVGIVKGDLDVPWLIQVEPIGAMALRFPGLQRVEMKLDPRGIIDHAVNGGRMDTMTYARDIFLVTLRELGNNAVDPDAFLHDVTQRLGQELETIRFDN